MMSLKSIIFISTLFLMISCSQKDTPPDFDLQGHRGARGLLPENTIPSFLEALKYDVNTIELDLVVTGDGDLLVSHEPWFNHTISSHPNGDPVTEDEAMSLNIYKMTSDEIQQFDVGKRGNPNFPTQKAIQAVKPLFRDAVEAIEMEVERRGMEPVNYNIETKSQPEWYGVYVPEPDEFAEILYAEILELENQYKWKDRVIIQSFDPATLVQMRQLDDSIAQAILVFDDSPLSDYIDRMDYVPEIWSPEHKLLTPEKIEFAHRNSMRVIPWTINSISRMREVLDLGVDGIITDYPDSAALLKN